MISAADVTALIRDKMPDAVVMVIDRTGTQDHLVVEVTSASFAGVGLMERHRMVQRALAAAMEDGRIHAAEIKTQTP